MKFVVSLMISGLVHAVMITSTEPLGRETENTLLLKKATTSAGLTQLRIIKRTKKNSKKYSVESGSSKSVAVVNDVVSQVELEKGLVVEYPHFARINNIEGSVQVVVRVDRRGRMLSSRLSKSSGHEILDYQAMESVKKATFSPKKINGKKVTGELEIEINFNL